MASDGRTDADTEPDAPALSETTAGESSTEEAGIEPSDSTTNERNGPDGEDALTSASPGASASTTAAAPGWSEDTDTTDGSEEVQTTERSVADAGRTVAETLALRPTARREGMPETETDSTGSETSTENVALCEPPSHTTVSSAVPAPSADTLPVVGSTSATPGSEEDQEASGWTATSSLSDSGSASMAKQPLAPGAALRAVLALAEADLRAISRPSAS